MTEPKTRKKVVFPVFKAALKKPEPAAVMSAYIFGIIGLGFFTNQSEFSKILLFWLPMFAAYLAVIFRSSNISGSSDYFSNLNFWLILAVVFRFLLLFSFPSLSDDVFRFIWDGRLWNAGINPFEYLPTYFMKPENQVKGLDLTLFNQLNSSEYFTIYPPVCQAVFFLSTAVFPESVYGSMFLMKCFLFACEIGTIILLPKVLRQLEINPLNSLIYALNPLIIIELCGNLHFESAMIFFLLLAVILHLKNKNGLSSVAFAFSVASKLLPLIFLPFLVKKMGWIKSIYYGLSVAVILLFLHLPMFSNNFIENFGSSLNLYFQKFEFNASVYYLARWIGYQQVGWNMIAEIGPGLAILSLVSILTLAFLPLFYKKEIWKNLPASWLWAISIYLIFTTTVHPWYLALPVFLCCFSRYRFPVFWSGLIFLTYINYGYDSYFENLYVVFFEYLMVFGILIFEIFCRKRSTLLFYRSNRSCRQ